MAIAGLYSIFNHWHEKGTVWCLSDTHFGDADLRAGQKNRPSDEEIIKRINAKVGKNDTLIHLGDCGDIECVKRLRGRKILICGNHDRGRTEYEEVFDEVYSGPLIIGEKLILSHEPIDETVLSTLGMINFSGHNHSGVHHPNKYTYNFCCEAIGFEPVHLNSMFKQGFGLNQIKSFHRNTIDKATKQKRKRGGKKII